MQRIRQYGMSAATPAAWPWLWPGLLPLAAAWLLVQLGAAVGVAVAALLLHGMVALVLAVLHRRQVAPFGLASQVTLARAGLVAVLAAALLQPALYVELAWWLAAIALIALLLDGVDGWLARRRGEASAFGARFDMEVDAAFILVLCVALLVSAQAGIWVLAIGLMRYAFVAAAWSWPWLEAPLPPSFRRKLVCVLQLAALLLAIAPLFVPAVDTLLLAAAFVLLALSFATDILWLQRNVMSTPR